MQSKIMAYREMLHAHLIARAVTGSLDLITTSPKEAHQVMQQKIESVNARYRELNRLLLAGYYFQVSGGLFAISLNVPEKDSDFGGHGYIDSILAQAAAGYDNDCYHDLMDRGMAFILSPISRNGFQRIADQFFFFGSGGWNMSRFDSFLLPEKEAGMVYQALMKEFYRG